MREAANWTVKGMADPIFSVKGITALTLVSVIYSRTDNERLALSIEQRQGKDIGSIRRE